MAVDYGNRANNIEKEIQRLEHQLKLLQELDRVQKSHASSLAGTVAIQKEINDKYKLQNELIKAGIDITKNEFNLEQKINDIIEKEITLGEKLIEVNKKKEIQQKELLYREQELAEKEEERNRKAEEARKKAIRDEIEKYNTETESSKLQEQVLALQEKILENSKEQTAEGRKRELQTNKELKDLKEKQKLKEREESREKKSKESRDKSKESIKIPGLGTIGDLKNFSELSTSAKLFSVGAEVFNQAVGTFSKLFTDGINTIARNANTQFQNISTRTGMSYGTYRSGIAGMGNTLKSYNGLDLQDNLRTSDIQNVMNNLATQGVGQEQLFASAIETALTKSIVPYLDNLESSEMQQLNAITNGEMMKQVRGIAKVNNDLYDSNTVATKYLQQQLQYLAPMASVAGIELIQNDEQMLTYYEGLRAQGMSDYMIGQSINSINQMRYNQADTMRNGTTFQRYVMTNSYANGINPLLDGVGFANIYESSASQFGSMIPSNGGLLASAAGSALGMPGDDRSYYYYANANLDHNKALSNALKADYSGSGNDATKLFASGANQTAEQKQEAYLENISTEIAMLKVDSGHWFETLTAAVKGIATILITYLAGKAVKGVGSLLGGGKGAGIAGALTTFAGTGLGYQAMGVGASMGINSVPAATAAGIALPAGIAAGGLAVGGYGISKGVGDIQSGNTARGVISTAGGAAAAAGGIGVAGGMLAAGAANAWNPVGWGLLIAGSLAVAGTAIARATDTTVDLADEFDAKKNASVRKIKAYNEEYIDDLYDVKEAIRMSTSVEEAKQIALENGIITQEEFNDAAIQSKDALLELADVKIEDQNELNKGIEDLTAIYSDIKQGKIEGVGNSATSLMYTAQAFQGDYDDLTDTQKQEMNQFMQSYIKWAEEYGNEDDKWRVKQYGDAFSDGNFHKNDYNKIFDGDNEMTRARFEAFATSDEGAKILSRTDAFKDKYGEDGFYVLSDEYLRDYVQKAYDAGDIDTAKGYLGVLKDYDIPWDKLGSKLQTQFIEKYGEDIKSYRVGLDSVPYDNYPALLHEGEAVLTASTANELRNLVDEYREAKEDSIRIAQAIQDQTTVLVERLDAIYTKIPSSGEAQAQEIMPGRLEQNVRSMSLPFN